jgi:hypothetical protein
MSEEYVPTGHRIFRGGKHIEMEVISTEMKPFVIHQPGDMEAEVTASSSTPHDDAAEDIAARIAGDRKQFQADILALAKAKKAEEDTEDGVSVEAADGEEASAADAPAEAAGADDDDLGDLGDLGNLDDLGDLGDLDDLGDLGDLGDDGSAEASDAADAADTDAAPQPDGKGDTE